MKMLKQQNTMDHVFIIVRMKRITHRLYCAVIVLLCLAGVAQADREISDAKKKEKVYRMYAAYKKDFPEVEDISPLQAIELLNQNKVVFVDTRKPAEMAVSMLPGAVSEKDFLNDPQQYRDKTIIGYCTISYRSGVFARDLANRGISIINLQGGILAWTLEGGRVFNPDGKEVKQIHVYGDKWDYAPAGYETVKF